MRAICHCTICQRFNQSDFADVTVFYRKDVEVKDDKNVTYTAHKKPAIVMRGQCSVCTLPAIEQVSMPLMPKLTIVPTRNLTDHSALPDAGLHIFYDKRVRDMYDDVPNYSGYMQSQIAFGAALIRGMVHRRG
ncbi:hypothetical protein GCM10007385_10080 [Tateyamaria omphalii]|nr:hypothetical protein GCM10007385_10080 [Tateyamaria omphalii]